VVGRHGIQIRPWPHPDPVEVMRAHRIMERVQEEQRRWYSVKEPRQVLAVTPTYSRAFQVLHLTGLLHSLRNVSYPLTWIVVEAGGTTNATASMLAPSGITFVHIPFPDRMPHDWVDRHATENRMRLHALRYVWFPYYFLS
jgi:putative beta-1,4-xylosyltransferase IRX14